MEENRDTAGWGIVGTVWAMMIATPTLMQQIGTAALVAGTGWLASYIMKRLVIYGEGQFNLWRENRKKTKNPN